MAIRTVAFDLGGVFFLPGGHEERFALGAQRLGIPVPRLRALLWHGPDIEAANIGRMTAEEYAERSARRLDADVDPADLTNFIAEIFCGDLNEALTEYAKTLRPRCKVVALTNGWSFVHRMLDRHGIGPLFDDVVNSATEGVRKPDRRIFDVLVERADCAAQEVAFIDDVLENVRAASALGIHAIHFETTDQAVAALDALLHDS